MNEHTATRPAMEPRRASESVVDVGTRTEDERGWERESTSAARARSTGANRQLARQPPAHGRQVARRVDEATAPAPAQAQHTQERKSAPAVRLDMDLDVEIDLKAKIHGDLELAIL
ncbi:hypothetical protein C8A03DRAFT_17004 [Achaetomium macrosporum]|uniref:Uncharacterized protein n=1 Tax=Achaetomium macrosporum TaxID=79813 RepID=A0AAN7HD71_9PEZI|nr:hypothetical protein C8A03DRAFT_17004 [Achaetomium macrosporum]